MPLQKLNEPMKVCKICLKTYKSLTFYSFLHDDYCLCDQCYKKLTPRFVSFKHGDVKCLSIYDYDEEMKSLIYQFKGCYDIALSEVFLSRFTRELFLLYKGYTIIPVPSYHTEDLKREFNHVLEIFSNLKLPIERLIEKTDNIKQSSFKKNERANIAKHLKMSNVEKVRNKKILLVDDIHTTGSTIEACINLIKQGHPKNIQVLVIAKTRDDKYDIKKHA